MPIFRQILSASSVLLRQKTRLNRLVLKLQPASSVAYKMAPKLAEHVASTHSVVQSESDKNSYRGLTLKNGIKILVVSDPTTDKAAAALNVQVGYLTDPREIPGLAHFCEHMLFLGTKKFPSESQYNEFLSSHGGVSNAYTAMDHTCYFFDITPEHLKPATDIFAQFFHEPLFDQSCTDRELQAVNSEHEKNVKQDMWRLWHLEGVTANPAHDFSKFGTGNKETLDTVPKQKGLDVREALLEFHTKYYSSNIMSVCVLGKENLDDLSDLAIELFAGVPNKNAQAPTWEDHPFTDSELRIQTKVVPVKDLKQMVITFPIPDYRNDYKTNQGNYVSHLVAHEGEGSLLSYLKNKGWVNTLGGGVRSGGRGFGFLTVSMKLTPEGVEHTDEIATALFQYLEMLRSAGPQQWIFEELKNIGAMHYKFKSKESPIGYVSNIAECIHTYEWEDVLSGPYLVSDYKPELITELLNRLVPEKMRITLVSNTFEGKTDKTEPYYGTNYSVEPIPNEKIQNWKNVGKNPLLKMPAPNEFIPTNFALAAEEKKFTQKPELIINDPSNRIWFMQDKEYNLPTNVISFDLRTPLAYKDPISACLTNVAVTCFNDANNEYFYSAGLAGLSYSLENHMDGLTLKIRGYNERQQAMLKKVCERLAGYTIDADRFEILKESCVRRMRNFAAEQPYQHALYYMNNIMTEKYWTYDDILKVVDEECTLDRCQQHLKDLLKELHVEALVHGNMTSEEATKIGETVRGILKYNPLSFDETKSLREFKLKDSTTYSLDRFNEFHPTNAIMTLYQVGAARSDNIRGVALNDLLCQTIDQPCFDVLRTKEQLGYIVSAGSRKKRGTYGVRFIVQSEKNPTYVAERIDKFVNENFRTLLNEMTDEVFDNHKEAIIALKLEKPKKLHDKSALLMREILTRQYVFNREQIEADEIRKLSKKDLIEFYEQYLANGGSGRSQLMVNVESRSNPGEKSEGVKVDHVITDLDAFKKDHVLLEPEVGQSKL